MTTFATMRSRIADDLSRTDLTTQINLAINRAIIYFESERFWFSETTGTFSTIANQQSYGTGDSLPSDIKEIDDPVRITISSTNIPSLKRIPYAELLAKDIGAFVGQPSEWSWFQSKMYFYPRPDSIKTITLSYQKSYTALSGDSDTNDWTVYAESLIESAARYDLFKNTIRDEAQASGEKEQIAYHLNCLREKNRKLVSVGRVTPTSW